jgi:hypothetical protein
VAFARHRDVHPCLGLARQGGGATRFADRLVAVGEEHDLLLAAIGTERRGELDSRGQPSCGRVEL